MTDIRTRISAPSEQSIDSQTTDTFDVLLAGTLVDEVFGKAIYHLLSRLLSWVVSHLWLAKLLNALNRC